MTEGAIGAALTTFHIYFEKDRALKNGQDKMKKSFLGPYFCEMEIDQAAKRYKATYEKFKDYKLLADKVAGLIAKGNVIG